MPKAIVLVPYLNIVEHECERGLQQLELKGIKVWRQRGSSAIDVARNEMISDALHDNFEAMLFIDADISFSCDDALRLIERPEPVISGVFAKKGKRQMASVFANEVKEVVFGEKAPESYPLLYAGTGFLRIQASVLRRMIVELNLPLCNTRWGRGMWPFFQPLIVPDGVDKFHYLGEDWSFSYRCHQIGITPLADTTIRLLHWGHYPYSWEEAGSGIQRFKSYRYLVK